MKEKNKTITVTGTPNARVNVVLKNSSGQTYNQATRSFETANNTINVVIGLNGRSVVPVIFPEISSDEVYSLAAKPTSLSRVSDKLIARENYIEKQEKIGKVITWTTSHNVSGYAVASALSTTFSGPAPEGFFNPNTRSGEVEDSSQYFSLTGAITKSSALLYVTKQPSISSATGGDFTNSQNIELQVRRSNKSLGHVLISDDTNLRNGFRVYGIKINEDITITKEDPGGHLISLSGYRDWPFIIDEDKLYFSDGGHHVDIQEASIAGSGTASLTAAASGYIHRIGHENDTITWRLQEAITTVPNAYDQAINCTVGETVTVDCSIGDTDANKLTKTYARVSGPSKGTVGNNSTAFNNNTFFSGDNKSKITYNNTSGAAGATDTFVFKSNDGTTDSANKTITITLVE